MATFTKVVCGRLEYKEALPIKTALRSGQKVVFPLAGEIESKTMKNKFGNQVKTKANDLTQSIPII